MDVSPDRFSPHPLWVEAAAAVQADDDVDVRLEARGLVIAEMAEVTIAERMAALQPGSTLTVLIRHEGWLTGVVARMGSQFLVLRATRTVLIPSPAICGVSALPRVLHHERTPASGAQSPTWRSLLRELLGEPVQVATGGFRHRGRLTWVGADHVSIEDFDIGSPRNEMTIPWTRIDAVTLPATWE